MARIRYCVAMSLDGFIAGPNGEFDWIVHEPAIDFGALFAQFDTFLMGRRTYELFRDAKGPPLPDGTTSHVYSRTLPDNEPGVTVRREVTEADVAAIRAAARKDIWLFGGGELFRSFLERGLVDTVELTVVPVMLGRGQPMLPDFAERTALTLTEHQAYPSGIVKLVYAVA